MIELHFAPTPNSMKIVIMLEEIGLPYQIVPYDIFRGDQLAPDYALIHPNRKLPAIVDTKPALDEEPLPIFESGAILQYLAEKSGKLLAQAGAERWRTLSWLTWQVASIGPMGGQASHFTRYAPDGNEYAVERYCKELKRLLLVLEHRLQHAPFVAGESYSIADIAIWPARFWASFMGTEPYDLPAVARWVESIGTRPAVQRALGHPDCKVPQSYVGRRQRLSKEQWSNMFGEKMHNGAARCILP